ncbi:MAG: hypothetical protein EZS28_022470 [Streblomastix strix]|uniref:Uncharacterized protein n=1 Tax=Streblomastix strix TaxID=222440 RepID=A0A5J4VIA7_9EUKA|nr:MAG: hypothetical protein EZS28_022470 [Streblomastix strix]
MEVIIHYLSPSDFSRTALHRLIGVTNPIVTPCNQLSYIDKTRSISSLIVSLISIINRIVALCLYLIIINKREPTYTLISVINRYDRRNVLDRLAKIQDELDSDEKQDDNSIFMLEKAVSDVIHYLLMSNDYSRKKYYDPPK